MRALLIDRLFDLLCFLVGMLLGAVIVQVAVG